MPPAVLPAQALPRAARARRRRRRRGLPRGEPGELPTPESRELPPAPQPWRQRRLLRQTTPPAPPPRRLVGRVVGRRGAFFEDGRIDGERCVAARGAVVAPPQGLIVSLGDDGSAEQEAHAAGDVPLSARDEVGVTLVRGVVARAREAVHVSAHVVGLVPGAVVDAGTRAVTDRVETAPDVFGRNGGAPDHESRVIGSRGTRGFQGGGTCGFRFRYSVFDSGEQGFGVRDDARVEQ